jgi:hypothetical protein
MTMGRSDLQRTQDVDLLRSAAPDLGVLRKVPFRRTAASCLKMPFRLKETFLQKVFFELK